MESFDRDAFCASLAQLVTENSSIAEVCRQAQINRQQFNKYLSGENIPSVAILYRIASALGVGLDRLCGQTGPDGGAAVNRGGLNDLFLSRCFPGAPQVSPGYYLEVVTYDVCADQYLLSLSKMTPQEKGGLYERVAIVDTMDGTEREQNFRGRYYEAGEKISVFYANISEPNAIGALALRKMDPYGRDLVGIKLAHRFSQSFEPMAAPVAFRYLGEENTDRAELVRMCRVVNYADLPASTSVLVDYLKQKFVLQDNRVRL